MFGFLPASLSLQSRSSVTPAADQALPLSSRWLYESREEEESIISILHISKGRDSPLRSKKKRTILQCLGSSKSPEVFGHLEAPSYLSSFSLFPLHWVLLSEGRLSLIRLGCTICCESSEHPQRLSSASKRIQVRVCTYIHLFHT